MGILTGVWRLACIILVKTDNKIRAKFLVGVIGGGGGKRSICFSTDYVLVHNIILLAVILFEAFKTG